MTGGALVPLLAGPVHATATEPAASISAVPAPAAATTPAVPLPNPALVHVRVSRGGVSRRIPPGFVGFSFEFPAVREYTGSNPHRINPVLVRLIRSVAPGQAPVLRIGGNSTDDSWWPIPGITPGPGITYTLTDSWLATTRALAVDTGAKLILGLNLEMDRPAETVAEARAYRTGIGTRHIEALEIGNEPELYEVYPWYLEAGGVPFYARPATYNFKSYIREVTMLARRIPGFELAGPATNAASWLAHLPRMFAAEPRLNVVTYHRYPLLACFSQPGDPRYPTIPNLLTLDASRDLLAGVAPQIALAHSHGATFRLDELNSVACMGQAGISDTFASALWMLDTLFSMARAGVDGVNIHTLPSAVYRPFAFARVHGKWVATVSPEYYALLMFVRAAPPGSRLLGVSETPSADVRSRATIGPSGLIHVLLINDSLTSGHTVLVRPPVRARTAVLERLRAPSAAATDGVTLAGQSFGEETTTGALAGKVKSIGLPSDHGRYLIRLPASSAALVTFAPAAA